MQNVGMMDSRIVTADLTQRRAGVNRGQGKNQIDSELTPEQQKAKQVSTQFEALMVKQMLSAMQGSTKMFGEGFGGEYFQGMFLDAIAQEVSEQGTGLGLGKMLYEQMMKSSSESGKSNLNTKV